MRCLMKLVLLALLALVVVAFVLCQFFVKRAGSDRIYDDAAKIPAREVGLVLGTSERLNEGGENPFFKKRIDAAAELYRRGKVRHLLVSGDNRTHGYNEPADMRRALLARGVPARAISLDYAGLRTLDSIVRAKEVFGQTRFTVISQRDHDARALLIAKHYDIDAIAFAATDVRFRYAVRAHIHEWFARVKVVLDLYVLQTRPRHLGPKITLPVGNRA
jgi:SanA protein